MNRVALIGYGEVGRMLAEDLRSRDADCFGGRGMPGFARNNDWRVESDRILAHPTEGTRR